MISEEKQNGAEIDGAPELNNENPDPDGERDAPAAENAPRTLAANGAEQPDAADGKSRENTSAETQKVDAVTTLQNNAENVLPVSERRKLSAKRWALMIAAIIMMSSSVYFFQTPNDFTLGGIAGIAIIISSFVTPHVPFLTQGVIMMVINVALLIIGFIVLGKKCTGKTIFCSLFYTAIIWLLEYFDVIGLISPETHKLTNEPFLELVYGILLYGIGGALIFNSGSSSGGTDIIALILKKYTRLNVGMALLIIDMTVVVISFYTFSLESALFSVIGLFTKSFLLDSVIESMGKTKYLTIITENIDLISDYILKVIHHSYTFYEAEGGYTHKPKKILVTVCKRSEAFKLKMKLAKVDPTAFVIITDANEILGKGFGGTL